MALTFHPEDSSFNRANALYLAHAADVAYLRAPGAAAMERLGLKAIAFRNKVTRTRGFLGVCDTHAVLAFRGSDPVTLPNWLTDMVVELVDTRDVLIAAYGSGARSRIRRILPGEDDVLGSKGLAVMPHYALFEFPRD